MLVLVAGVVTAYFSRALQESRSQSTSLGGREAEWLMTSATEMILGDFVDEMAAGSEEVETGHGPVFRPWTFADPDNGFNPLTPTMAPQRSDELEDLPNLVKVSLAGVPFYEGGPGYGVEDGPARASAVSTEEPSLNGRFIQRSAWNMPRLMTETEFQPGDGGFEVPDWIYVDREGKTPNITPADLSGLADASHGNRDFVLGRYAYVVYDVGGLLDVNVLGNFLPDLENRHRGRLHQVSLADGVGPVEGGALEEFGDFVADWRWPVLAAAEPEEAMESLFDARRDFIEVDPDHQGFVTRFDLLSYVEKGGTGIPTELLPFLTVYSRSLNAPHWRPDLEYWEVEEVAPDELQLDFWAGVAPQELNPDLALVRFDEAVVLERGTGPELQVPAGTPVMPRRFPLPKLDLFNVEEEAWNAGHAADLLYYFGLERAEEPDADPDVFRYVRAVEGPRIARLSEVAEQGREPNFFEILRAVILAGSLGKSAGQTMTWDMPRDISGDLHALQIGANIIDQWDEDDIPTTVQFPEGGGDPWLDPLEMYGMENLPYINMFAMVPHRPEYERDLFQIWATFDVWNPHQNATTVPDVNGFRAVPYVSPASAGDEDLHPRYDQVWLYYTVRGVDDIPESLSAWHQLDDRYYLGGGGESMIGLNEERSLAFPAAADYSELVTVGGGTEPPEAEGDAPGVLVWQEDVGEQSGGTIEPQANPGVGRFGWRTENLQINLNTMYDHEDGEGGRDGYSPYEASTGFEEDGFGARVYQLPDPDPDAPDEPSVIVFTGLDDNFWVVEPPLPPAAVEEGPRVATEETRVYARYAVKDFNALRAIRPSISAGGQNPIPGQYDPNWGLEDVPPSFALQVDTGRGWKTYQRVDGWFRRSAGLELRRGAMNYGGPERHPMPAAWRLTIWV